MFNKKGFGAEIDLRSPEEQAKDYSFEETVSASSIEEVDWKEKKESEWRSFPIFNQNGSGSCVAQTMAKILGVMFWLKYQTYIHFSATHIYQRRSNKPNSGMIGINAFQIAQEGTTLEALTPSQNMTDQEMDSVIIEDYKKKVGDVFKIRNYLTITDTGNIDKIASIIQKTGKPVMVWFYFKSKEWTTVPTIKDKSATISNSNRHSVTAVDFTLYKGEKALIIEDSWGTSYGKAGRRIITEEFFKARNWFSAYAMNFNFEESDKQVKYTFKNEMYFGQTNNDIAKMQDVLKAEGCFPTNIGSTGYYGNITAKAVYKFQVKYNVASMTELDALAGKVVGPKTLKALNSVTR